MQLKSVVSAATISSILKNGGFAGGGYRLLDCTSAVLPKPDYNVFKEKFYGNFDHLITADTSQRREYLSSHIPEAVHADINVATYPSKYEFYARYPPEIFEKYMRLLGVNAGDQIVLYGRGPAYGMMFPSAIAWLLKTYGHERISILDGGFAQWVKRGGEVTSMVPKFKEGTWKALTDRNRVISFEELSEKDSAGNNLFDKIGSVNFLDARARGQFDGAEETGLDPAKVGGSNLPGTKSAPAAEMFTKDGLLKPTDELRKWLSSCGLEKGKTVITMCNRGLQASMVAFAVENVDPSHKVLLYGGSLKEIEQRDPAKISGGKKYEKS